MAGASDAAKKGKRFVSITRGRPSSSAPATVFSRAGHPRMALSSRTNHSDGLREGENEGPAGIASAGPSAIFSALPSAAPSSPASTPPQVQVRESDLAPLRAMLPLDVWTLVLRHLDERALVASERVSRGLYSLACAISRPRIDPRVEPWLSQSRHCEETLSLLNLERKSVEVQLRTETLLDGPVAQHSLQQKFEKALAELAASTRCLSFKVQANREIAVINALQGAKAWQLADMTVTSEVKSPFLAQLESALRRRGVRRELHLRLSSATCMVQFNPASTSLRLTRLCLLSDLSGELTPVIALLQAANFITELAMVINSRHCMKLLKALERGTHALEGLGLHQYAGPELIKVLALKPGLRELELYDCALRDREMGLACLLRTATGLESLCFVNVKFEAGSTTGCAPLLMASRLHTIKFLRCPLFVADAHLGRVNRVPAEDEALHGDLAHGLSMAPQLRALWLASLSEPGDLFLLKAFARNPVASCVRILEANAEAVRTATDAVRAIRAELNLPSLEFSWSLEQS